MPIVISFDMKTHKTFTYGTGYVRLTLEVIQDHQMSNNKNL